MLIKRGIGKIVSVIDEKDIDVNVDEEAVRKAMKEAKSNNKRSKNGDTKKNLES